MDTAASPAEIPAQNGYNRSFELETEEPQRGRPSLDQYQEPDQENEFATNANEILENFRFFGILLKKQDDGFKRIETISRRNAKCIDEVRSQYGPGDYQLRLTDPDGQEDRISFTVKAPQKTEDNAKSGPLEQEHFLSGLRRDLKDEIRSDYEADLKRLQSRLQIKDDELDEKSKKVRELLEEIGELRSHLANQVRAETEPLRVEVKQLERELQTLRDQLRDKEIELRLLDSEDNSSVVDAIIDALDNPAISQIVQGFLGGQSANIQQLNDGQRVNPETSSEQPVNETNEDMSNMLQGVFNSMIQKAAGAMMEQKPDLAGLKQFFDEATATLQQHNVQTGPQFWIQLSRTLIQFAQQNNVTAAKAAETIGPILERFDQARTVLESVSPEQASKLLVNMYRLQISEAEQKFLTAVLGQFKEKLAQTA